MHQLCEKIMSELDISKLTDKLRQGKVESSALTPKEKYDTWEAIKIKSTVVLIFSVAMAFSVFYLSNHKYAFLTMLLFLPFLQFLRFHKDSFFNVGNDIA
jgi:hypothetical protein